MDARRSAAIGIGLTVLLLNCAGVAQRSTGSPAVAATGNSLTVGNKEYDAEKELARMVKRYGLTWEQRARIQPILLDQQKQVHVLGEDETFSDAEWASAVRKVHQQTVAKIKPELTDTQAARYATDEAKRAKNNGDSDEMDEPPGGPPPGGPPPGEGPDGPPGP